MAQRRTKKKREENLHKKLNSQLENKSAHQTLLENNLSCNWLRLDQLDENGGTYSGSRLKRFDFSLKICKRTYIIL